MNISEWKKYPLAVGKLYFPKDEGRHQSLMEWWYGNFHLKTASGHRFSFMVAYFKTGLRMVSLGDLDNDNYKSFTDQGILRRDKGKQGLNFYGLTGVDVWHQKAGEAFSYTLKCSTREIKAELQMDSRKPPLAVGGDGLVELGSSGSSYYYSLSRLSVNGTLQVGKLKYPVSGLGWMDHQYGQFHPTLKSRGYEWFSIQLDNGHDIICYNLFEKDSPKVPLLNALDAENKVHLVRDFSLSPVDFWLSPQGKNYARKWQITGGNQGYDVDLIIETALRDQLINPILYEGRTNIYGYCCDQKVTGIGFAELCHSHNFRFPTLNFKPQ